MLLGEKIKIKGAQKKRKEGIDKEENCIKTGRNALKSNLFGYEKLKFFAPNLCTTMGIKESQ